MPLFYRNKPKASEHDPAAEESELATPGDYEYLLALQYKYGEGVTANQAESDKFMRLAANKNHGHALTAVGKMYDTSKMYSACGGAPGMYNNPNADAAEAFKSYSAAAEQLDPEGEYRLAKCHEEGVGCEADTSYKEVARLCKVAADKGWDAAAWYYGMCLNLGAGVEQDLEEADRYWQMAADHGDDRGMFCIAQEHWLARPESAIGGSGLASSTAEKVMPTQQPMHCCQLLPPDTCLHMPDCCFRFHKQAIELMKLSASMVDSLVHTSAREWSQSCSAAAWMAIQYAHSKPNQGDTGFDKDYDIAASWYRRASKLHTAGLDTCMLANLGEMLTETEDGKVEGAFFKKLAADIGGGEDDKGVKNACYDTAHNYKAGENGMTKDATKAEKYFKMGAELGDANCMHFYALALLLHDDAQGCKDEAIRYFRLCAEADDSWISKCTEELTALGVTLEGTEVDQEVRWQPEKAHASFEVEPDGQRAWFSGPQDVYASMLGDVEWRPGSGSQTFEIEMEAPVPHATATPTGPGPGQRSGFADRCGSILVGVARPDFPTDVSTEVRDGRKAGWGMFFNEHPFSASASYITSGWYFGDVCVHKCVDEPPIKAGDVLRITLAAGVLTCTRNGRPVEGELKMDGPAVNPAVSAYFTGTAFHLV